jgi:hypothetical protein
MYVAMQSAARKIYAATDMLKRSLLSLNAYVPRCTKYIGDVTIALQKLQSGSEDSLVSKSFPIAP